MGVDGRRAVARSLRSSSGSPPTSPTASRTPRGRPCTRRCRTKRPGSNRAALGRPPVISGRTPQILVCVGISEDRSSEIPTQTKPEGKNVARATVIHDMTTASTAPVIDVRRAADRFATEIGWLDSHHSFSFGHHYDPKQHRPRAAAREQRRHRPRPARASTLIRTATWRSSRGCSSGELEHKDSERNRGVLYPGLAQRMSAGRGIWHSEMNNSGWTTSTSSRCGSRPTPSRSIRATSNSTSTANSPRAGSCRSHRARATTPPSRSARRGAVLCGGRLQPGETVRVPDDRHVHVFVPVGSADLQSAGVLAHGRRGATHRSRAARPHRRRGRCRGVDLGDRLTS